MRVRLRAPGGQHTAELADDATVGDLKATVFDKTGVAPAAQELKAGFPPKKIEGDDGTSLASVGVTNGESITVTEVASAAGAAPSAAPSPPQISAMDEDEALARAIAASLEDSGNAPASVARRPRTEAVRVVIDSDNSCLFNAVGYVMRRSLREAPGLRRVIADVVSGDEFTYNEGFLGKPNAEYCAWIQDPKHWGGAVELSILAKHFGREIAAYDIQTERCDVYGQGEAYEERVMLLYDGLHYDALALNGPGGGTGRRRHRGAVARAGGGGGGCHGARFGGGGARGEAVHRRRQLLFAVPGVPDGSEGGEGGGGARKGDGAPELRRVLKQYSYQ
jgi:ubiquitin thioesterase OTU1